MRLSTRIIWRAYFIDEHLRAMLFHCFAFLSPFFLFKSDIHMYKILYYDKENKRKLRK